MDEQTRKQHHQGKRVMALYELLRGQDREALDQGVVSLLGEVDEEAANLGEVLAQEAQAGLIKIHLYTSKLLFLCGLD